MLTFQFVPQHILAQSTHASENGKTVILFTDQQDQEIGLYVDNNGQELKRMLPNDIEVFLLEIGEDYSLIAYVNKNIVDDESLEEMIEGYVDNKYIKGLEDTFINQSDPTKISESELVTDDVEEAEELEAINEGSNDEKMKKSDHQSEINLTSLQSLLQGYAQISSVAVYQDTTKSSKALKSYPLGSKLKYYPHTRNWYRTGVYINGKKQTGYIHVNDVSEKAPLLNGYAKVNRTHVYDDTSKKSTSLKSYALGSQLKYYPYSNDWFRTGVYINGKKQVGYIHAKDVGVNPPLLNGYALKSRTHVYSNTSKQSSSLKSYTIGSQLKYFPYNKEWYKTGVYMNGKKRTGYIHKSDVGDHAPLLNGFAQVNRTHVYSKTSKNSTSLKSYALGSQLRYYPYTDNWYKTGVYINGKKKTGYIHKEDVDSSAPLLSGYAQANRTHVYSKTSKSSTSLKSYALGSQLKYYPHSKNWYKTGVYMNGKKHTGYIHVNDVSVKKPVLNTADKLKTIGNNDQLILVTSKGYNTDKAKIETYERNKKGRWIRKLSVSGYIGKNGFARNKVEGDGKSPVGKYSLGTSFGQKDNPGTKLPFKSITNDDVWVDDPNSKLYNTWQSKSKTSSQWKSAENMNHELYTYGFVINYNTNPIVPNKGSAIFLHVGNSYTVGCTATSEANVISMMKWLDPKKNPVIIQTPEKELSRY